MKKLLLLILLLSFSYNESKAQDSVTVTFRLKTLIPYSDSSAFLFLIDYSIPNIIGNFSELNATYLNGIPLLNYDYENSFSNWTFEDEDGDGISNYVTLKLKFPNSSIGQELNFTFIVTQLVNTFVYVITENDNYSSINENLTSCFTYSAPLEQFFTSNSLGSDDFIIRPIIIPSNDATFSYCWSCCLQCNVEASLETPTFIALESTSGNVWIDSNHELRIQHPMDFTQMNIYSIDGRLLHKTNPSNYFDLKSINTSGMMLIELVGNSNRVVLKQALLRD